MKILIIRHGDPDYVIDSLTEKGRVEAELLSRKLEKLDVKAFYVSPLGRARDTAEYTLKKLGRTATVCDWLREFPPTIDKPDVSNECIWDWLPQDWTPRPEFYDLDKWLDAPEMVKGNVREHYEYVTSSLDNLIKEHGYERSGNLYLAKQANNDTLVLFCHFGLECVLLSRLLNIPPMLLWHGACAAPTSVTTLVTEERREGIAYFRMSSFGDISHLYKYGEPPAFSARFCETFANKDERHD